MCGHCRGGPPPGIEWFTTGVGDSLRERRQARNGLALALDRLDRGVRVSAPAALMALRVAGPTGASETPAGFSAAVDAVLRALGEELDPLDPAVLDRVREAQP